MRRPTQVDVAKRAGVSRATVSYVINGQASDKGRISPDTVNRVMQAVAELGYEPDAGAQALRTGSSKTIGLIIPDLHNPHFWENAEGVEQAARAAGYRLLLSSMDQNAQYGEDIFRDLSGRRIDALILMRDLVTQSTVAQVALARNSNRKLPVVEISDHFPENYNLDRVVSDYRMATFEAKTHLFALGHRRIGLVHGVANPDMASDRVQAYQETLRNEGIPVDDMLIVNCGPTFEDGYQAALRLFDLADRPSAIVAINDLLALGAMRAAGDRGQRVPEDLSLIGFDDIPTARYLTPRLTTSSKDAVRMGREAVRLALERIAVPNHPSQIITLPTRFIVRESTGPAPGRGAQ